MITRIHLKNSELSFFTNNASFGHFHQVSMNSITNWTFSKFKVQFYYNYQLGKSLKKRYLPLSFSKYNETTPKLVYS